MGTQGIGPDKAGTKMQAAKRVCPKCGSAHEQGDAACGSCGFVFASVSAVLSPGTLLHGRYEIDQLISTGGMGHVYLARDRDVFGRDCVVKQVIEKIESAEHRRRLEEEALRMAILSHPGIAMIIDHFVERGQYFMVVERIRGKTLGDVFKDRHGQIGEAEVVAWAIAICDVIAYLHAEGVVHRDISPDNIMLTDRGSVSLIDFGTLRELRYVAAGGTAGMGKYGYAPPEQWEGNAEPRSDLFALGATLYYLLTGYLPLSDSYQTKQMAVASDRRPEFPPIRTRNGRISRSLESILLKALALDVNDRFTSATEMGEALARLQRELTKRPPRRREQWLLRHRIQIIIVGGTLALGLIAAGIYLVVSSG